MTSTEYAGPGGSTIKTVRSHDDVAEFDEWLAGTRRLAVDTETTGLDVFTPDWELRLVQLADEDTAWVFEANRGFDSVWRTALEGRPLVFHNSTYDLLALDRLDLYPNTFDTAMLSQLADPSGKHGLKHLAAEILGADTSEGEKLLSAHFRSEGWTKETGWSRVDLRHPDYVLYAGLDAILTARLFPILRDRVREAGVDHLVEFERTVAHLMAQLTQRGMRVDTAYAYQLGEKLRAEEHESREAAILLGVENPASTDQLREALILEGATLRKKTPTGKYAVDEEVLAGLDSPLAEAVLRMRRAGKFNTSYVDGTLDVLGWDGRSHPWIRPLEARTGRMSVSRPPLQQLPSGDSEIRSLFIADEGHLIGATDYANIELRVMAALADERTMKAAFVDGADLHQLTADAAGVDRKLGKMANFLVAYGGGARALSAQANIPQREAQKVLDAFNRTYPGIRRWSEYLQRIAPRDGYAVRTPTGRRLALDRDRIYAASNYVTQSTARDVLAQALVLLDAEGLFDHVSMVVHDEVIWQAPADQAEEFSHEVARIMEVHDFLGTGVDIPADTEVYGSSWGDGYRHG